MRYDLKLPDKSGQLIQVLQELPDKGDKFPTVLLVSGFGMDLHEYGYLDDVSRVLNQNGIQTFRFSYIGTGKSQGKFSETTLDKHVEQLKIVFNYIKADRFTNLTKIGIFAQSFGTAVVVAAWPLPRVKTLIFTSAPPDPYKSLSTYFRRQRGFNPEGISEAERADGHKTRVGPQFWSSLERINFFRKISEINRPILFIHGGNDRLVRAAETFKYYEQVQTRKKFLVIERANHGFSGQFRPKVVELISDWFSETL